MHLREGLKTFHYDEIKERKGSVAKKKRGTEELREVEEKRRGEAHPLAEAGISSKKQL